MCNLYDIGPGQGKRQETNWERIVFRGIAARTASNKNFGIRKTDSGLVLLSDSESEEMRWGFNRHFNPSINNARCEKLEGGIWHDAWSEKRRCVIPLSTYYEWSGPSGKKQTHAFQATSNDQWLWAAGVWEDSVDLGYCYSMITTAGSEKTGPIHDRMPALLKEDQFDEFLGAENPIGLILPSNEVQITYCENPLTDPNHEGPVFMTMLPGFE